MSSNLLSIDTMSIDLLDCIHRGKLIPVCGGRFSIRDSKVGSMCPFCEDNSLCGVFDRTRQFLKRSIELHYAHSYTACKGSVVHIRLIKGDTTTDKLTYTGEDVYALITANYYGATYKNESDHTSYLDMAFLSDRGVEWCINNGATIIEMCSSDTIRDLTDMKEFVVLEDEYLEKASAVPVIPDLPCCLIPVNVFGEIYFMTFRYQSLHDSKYALGVSVFHSAYEDTYYTGKTDNILC